MGNGQVLLTSPIIHGFNFGGSDINAGLDCIYLINSACNSKTQTVTVKESDHVLASNPFFGLPADMKGTTESYVPE